MMLPDDIRAGITALAILTLSAPITFFTFPCLSGGGDGGGGERGNSNSGRVGGGGIQLTRGFNNVDDDLSNDGPENPDTNHGNNGPGDSNPW